MTETLSILTILLIIARTLIGLGFVLVVFLMGVLMQSFNITLLNRNEKSIANIWVLGFLFTVATSQVLLVPMTLYFIKVSTATVIWWSLFLVLSIVTVIRCKDDIIDTVSSVPSSLKQFFLEKKSGGFYGGLAVFLISVQVLGSVFLYHYDDDDAIYVTTVATNIADNSFFQVYGPTGEDTSIWDMVQYLTNGWYDLLTIVCKSTGLNAAILMHTILPTFMILLSYAVIIIFSRILIKKESQRYLFLVFVSIINIFNNVSSHTSSSVFLMRMHQGKALFANFIIPTMFCVFLMMWKASYSRKQLWILAMANTCACAFSTSGLAFGAMLTLVYAMVYCVYTKRIKQGIMTAITVIPNVVFATIYILERVYEVWRW